MVALLVAGGVAFGTEGAGHRYLPGCHPLVRGNAGDGVVRCWDEVEAYTAIIDRMRHSVACGTGYGNHRSQDVATFILTGRVNSDDSSTDAIA